ncbi:MAG TPA: hypothetical protein PKD00_03300 [Burkholderiales bacterium]|nr:hypothetical protein [Burkholderiales bacterium]
MSFNIYIPKKYVEEIPSTRDIYDDNGDFLYTQEYTTFIAKVYTNGDKCQVFPTYNDNVFSASIGLSINTDRTFCRYVKVEYLK